MKTITRYVSDDGQSFDTERGARLQDAKLALEKWAADQGIGRGGEWTAEMIVRVMVEGAQSLSPILGEISKLSKIEKALSGRGSRSGRKGP